MSVIYKPTGMAREYSPYALNLYIGCSHHCKYCYAPHTLQRAEENYFGKPTPRKDVLKYLEKDLQKNVYHEQILLSFIGDVYCDNADDSATTRAALEMLSAHHAPVAVLSKGGEKMLRDLDVFIKTFASFEPTIEPKESLKLIERTLEESSVDHYKIGKINQSL